VKAEESSVVIAVLSGGILVLYGLCGQLNIFSVVGCTRNTGEVGKIWL